jgi:hypothetical protein
VIGPLEFKETESHRNSRMFVNFLGTVT